MEPSLDEAITAHLYAHSLPENAGRPWEGLAEHAEAVADLASRFAAVFGWAETARVTALLHDAGKASEAFQDYIRGRRAKGGDHSTWGARIAVATYASGVGRTMAACIAGHHAGLSDGGSLAHRLDRHEYDVPDASRWSPQPPLPALGLLRPTRPLRVPGRKRLAVCPDLLEGRKAFTEAFLIRMLFSCLVDADFLATERFISGGTVERGVAADFGALCVRLTAYLDDKTRKADPSPLNALRARILAHAVAKAALDPGFFTLTVPTGGGKTLTSLAFALDHARRHGKRRIVLVIPFTAIIEQSAQVIREAIGDPGIVLEHHATFDWERAGKAEDGGDARDGLGPLRRAAENWDAPIVVTTAVQFFESLFANRTSACRKLHNLADSVIVLDEAQTLPTHLLLPCLAALEELTENYGASVVLCTATQPAVRLQDGALSDRDRRISHGLDIPCERELAPDPPALYRDLVRVAVEVLPGKTSDDIVAARFGKAPQMLCIVNSRAHARDLFGRIDHLPGAVHLTTLMCPAHRRQVLDELRTKLKAGEPVRLVSTSLIEAGVDISFAEVWRAGAGIDQIAQAAGRCNREGELLPALGRVVVFTPADHEPPRALRTLQAAAASVMRDHPQPLTPEAVSAYFHELFFRHGLAELDTPEVDGIKGVLPAFARHSADPGYPFESVAAAFRLIDEIMEPVVVPWNDDAKAALDRVAHAAQPSRDDFRKLQQFTVGIPKAARNAWLATGDIVEVRPGFGRALLRFADDHLYRAETGIDLSDPIFRKAEDNVW